MSKIWEKGYTLDTLIERFTVGNDPVVDGELLPWDCVASAAHARMLGRAGVLRAPEVATLEAELAAIEATARHGDCPIPPGFEDCHSYLEHLLTERLGDLGRKIHTARSRNDQVLTALRLLYRARVAEIAAALAEAGTALRELAARHPEVPLPGYTHMRKAMPSSIGAWAGAFADALADDRTWLQAVGQLVDQCPAGSGAGFGVPLAIDRAGIAADLGFGRLQENPMYVQLTRGKFEAAILGVVSGVLLDLNRLATDLLLFSMPEFGFFRLPTRFCTGSSIMPQKKNPDVLELLRARVHEGMSLETRVKALCTSLPSGYNRDLQLTKEPTLQGLALVLSCLAVTAHLVRGLEVDGERCRAAMTPELFATARAYELVAAGMPFRDAYRQVAAQLAAAKPGPR